MAEKQIGNYTLLRELVKGGMGTLYLARHNELNRTVALKILRPEYSNDKNFVERFEREARTIAKLEHVNILQVYDFGRTEDTCYLVMEWVEGLDLENLLAQNGPLPWEIAAVIFHHVAMALQAAHSQSIVHRDIKLANILVKQNGTVKLADFGIARDAEMKNITRNDEMIGTPYAIPPEQIEGNSVTAQGDLFSLGAAMFHAVSGAQPFEGPSIAAIFENILKKEPLSLAELDTAAVPEFEEILRKCMAKNPKDRFESAEALDASLRKCLYQYRAINDRSEIEKYLVSPKEYIRQQRGTRIAEKMEEAEKLIAENKVFEALAVYREVLAMDPDNPKVEARISELSRRIPARQGTSVMGRAEKPDNARFHLTWIAFTTALILLSVTGVFILRGKSHSALKSGGPIITVQNTTPPVVAPIPLPEKKAADPAVSPVPLHRATRTKTAAMPETPAPAAPPQAALPVLPEPVKKDTCKGSLAFSSDVWADLYIDNVKSGRVPTKAPLVVACGSHELRLENNLGKQYFTKVIVEADKPLHLSVEKKAFE